MVDELNSQQNQILHLVVLRLVPVARIIELVVSIVYIRHVHNYDCLHILFHDEHFRPLLKLLMHVRLPQLRYFVLVVPI